MKGAGSCYLIDLQKKAPTHQPWLVILEIWYISSLSVKNRSNSMIRPLSLVETERMISAADLAERSDACFKYLYIRGTVMKILVNFQTEQVLAQLIPGEKIEILDTELLGRLQINGITTSIEFKRTMVANHVIYIPAMKMKGYLLSLLRVFLSLLWIDVTIFGGTGRFTKVISKLLQKS